MSILPVLRLISLPLFCLLLAPIAAQDTLGEELAASIPKPTSFPAEVSSQTRAPNPLGPTVRNESFPQPTKGLWGNRIAFEIGHGRFPRDSGWLWQRSDWFPGLHRHICQEDMNNPKIIGRWLIPYLQNAGASLFPDRCVDEQINEVIYDFNSTADLHTTGSLNWFITSTTSAWGGKYMAYYNNGLPQDSFSIDVRTTIPESGYYGVTVRYPHSSSGTTNAQYIVIDGAGYEHSYRMDQTRNGHQWLLVGRHYFEAGSNQLVMRITNHGTAINTYMFLDAVRFGGGMGSEDFGGGPSGLPRWQEAPVPWMKYSKIPSNVWSSSVGQSNDTAARFNHASLCQAELMLRHHSNGSTYHTGFGSEAYCHAQTADGLSTISLIYPKVVQSIRKHYRSNWTDRGIKTLATTAWPFDVILVELAFHDWLTDAEALMDAKFRRVAMRGFYEGLVDYFTQKTGVYLPEPPDAIAVRNVANGSVRLDWTTCTIGSVPDYYRVYYSHHPHCFKEYEEVTSSSQSVTIDGLQADVPYYFQIRSLNAGGASLPSETLAACVPTSGTAKSVMVVNGYDRFDWDIDELDNNGNYIIEHTLAISSAATSLGLNLALDSASRDAITSYSLPLEGYDLVDWFLGHNDGSGKIFNNAEKDALRLAKSVGNGTLLVSGARGISSLAGGSPDDQDFLNQVLRTAPAGQTSNTLAVSATASGAFDTYVDDLSFAPQVYNRLPSDVLTTDSATAFIYDGTSDSAGICRLNTEDLMIYLAFPVESAGTPADRAAIMERVLTLESDPSAIKSWALYD